MWSAHFGSGTAQSGSASRLGSDSRRDNVRVPNSSSRTRQGRVRAGRSGFDRILIVCAVNADGRENMADFDLMAAAVQLATEFRRRGMDSHLDCLRRLYADHRRRRAARQRTGDKTWDENMVITWLGLLRIPPVETVHQVLARD